MNKPKSISIIIPAYNEEDTLTYILESVLDSDSLGLKKEVIVVDDGSSDRTPELLKEFKDRIKTVIFSKNMGKGSAVREGIRQSTGDIILVQDADLEYIPDDYPTIIKPFLKDDASVVYGSRELAGTNKHSSKFFHIGGRSVTMLTNLLYGSNLTDVPTGYKAFRSDVIKNIPLKCVGFEFCPEATAHVLKRGIDIVEVPIGYAPRSKAEGKKIKVRDGIEAWITLIRVKMGL